MEEEEEGGSRRPNIEIDELYSIPPGCGGDGTNVADLGFADLKPSSRASLINTKCASSTFSLSSAPKNSKSNGT
jgi:hypothetical protein